MYCGELSFRFCVIIFFYIIFYNTAKFNIYYEELKTTDEQV